MKRQKEQLSYSLCDKFNSYRIDRSLCPLCLCGSLPKRAKMLFCPCLCQLTETGTNRVKR
nr:hypothetical protein [Microcystis aeruginosa]